MSRMREQQNSNSTLELVVNEQQLQNMSQIDLRPDNNQNEQQGSGSQQQQQQQSQRLFSLEQLKKWPSRFRDSFNAKMDEAKAKSNSRVEFVFEVIHSFSGIVIWFLCFFCTILIPIALFFIGLANLDDCQDRPSLPYLVFATGFVMTASNLFNLALALDLPILTNHNILTADLKNTIASIINIIFNCVVTFLYIICGYMVFTAGNSKHNQQVFEAIGSDTVTFECNRLLYNFTFWFIALTLGLFILLAKMSIVFFAYNKYRLAIIRGSTPRSQPDLNTIPTNSYVNRI